MYIVSKNYVKTTTVDRQGVPKSFYRMFLCQFFVLVVHSRSIFSEKFLNFPAQAEPSYEGSEPSRAGALSFSSWNQADNSDNIYVKK